eukprot:CAMPEP_0185728068 /NCGR_PEP_ID=MMETSP1171-20130828/3548_1 /TAXON_ID=374046 /ORGANISM="Helicotheca tamensis, Strain CCMP826" /LENGTH=233 /DNA_ID=CAMNT_0028396733 /DNA_START=116 /DNA_END=817 /DNA_ORIENTATION=+
MTTHNFYPSLLAVFTTSSFLLSSTVAWVPTRHLSPQTQWAVGKHTVLGMAAEPSLHGENSCFLPLAQLESDYYAPRIVQIAGAYPGITRQELEAVTSEPAAEIGQWTYDFSDPDGPQLGTVAIEGSNNVACAVDPVVIIAEHPSLGIELPKAVLEPVDLLVLVDRGVKTFAERKFMVLDDGTGQLTIGAYETKGDLPEGSEIVGRILLTQIPFLPCMQPSKTGFAEVDNYFSS